MIILQNLCEFRKSQRLLRLLQFFGKKFWQKDFDKKDKNFARAILKGDFAIPYLPHLKARKNGIFILSN